MKEWHVIGYGLFGLILGVYYSILFMKRKSSYKNPLILSIVFELATAVLCFIMFVGSIWYYFNKL